MKKPSRSELLAVIREFGKRAARRPPGDGWHTLLELAAEEGGDVSPSTMKYRIREAQRRGIVVETAIGTALDADGNAKRSAYYRLKPKP